jgi:hypothetical protein
VSPRAPLPLWRVTLERPTVAGRWLIPAEAVKIPAADEAEACRFAVRLAHAKADVAPWRPYTRHSLAFATAQPVAMSRESWERITQRKRRAA